MNARILPKWQCQAVRYDLKVKVQALVLWTFHKHLCGLTYIDLTIHTYIHNTQCTTITPNQTPTHPPTHTHTHKYIYLQITIHILAHAYIHTYICNFIDNKHRSNAYLDINTNMEKFNLSNLIWQIETHPKNTLAIINEKLGWV